MNLTCEAVEDFYVLYQEGDLHESVKTAIDDHLKSCARCKEVYETGDNFLKTKEAKKQDETLTTSSKLDQQIRLTLKLRRMRIIFLFFISVFIVYSFFQYVDNRKSLLYEVSSIEQTVRDLYFELEKVQWEGDPSFRASSFISELNEKTARIQRYLNIYEKKKLNSHPYQTNINFGLTSFIEVLHERYKNHHWIERDEEALSRMRGYIDEFTQLLTEERLKLNGLHEYKPTALFSPFAGETLKSLNQKIDLLAYSYSQFQQFPEEVEIFTEEEIKERARDVFQEPEAEVTLTAQTEEVIKGYGKYTTTVHGETGQFYASWEAYTGRLLEFRNHGQLLTEGELLEKKIINDKFHSYIQKLLNTKEFRVEYLGINYHYTSNVNHQLYTYKVIPTNGGFDTNASYRLYIDAFSGALASLFATDQTYFSHLSFSPSEIIVNKDEGLNSLEIKYPELKFAYKGTYFIPSLLSNQYELVHHYEGMGEGEQGMLTTIYMNVRTGDKEVIY